MRTGSLERKNNKFQIEKQCDIIRTIFIIKSDRSVNVQMTASLLIAVIYLIFISLGLPDGRRCRCILMYRPRMQVMFQ